MWMSSGGTFLHWNPAALVGEVPYKVVANLPYGITSAVLRHLLEARLPPRRMVVTVQREVAERIVARGGRMSVLAISIQFYGRPRLLFRLRPGAFYPPPEVESAVLRIDRHSRPQWRWRAGRRSSGSSGQGFAHPRKQLANSLAGGLGISSREAVHLLTAAGIDPRIRAERLDLADWARLARRLREHGLASSQG